MCISDSVRTVFLNSDAELRTGWRLLIFFAAFISCSLLLSLVIAAIGIAIPGFGAFIAGTTTNAPVLHRLAGESLKTTTVLAGLILSSALCARWLEHRSFSSVGYTLHKGWWRDFSLGLILGTVALAISIGIMTAARVATFELQTAQTMTLARNFFALLTFFLLAATFEELLVRGFVFQALISSVGPVAATAITSVAFSLLHFGNPNVTLFAAVNTLLAGIWLGIAYLMTRSLWLATALHMAWNFTMVFVFGLPVSGITAYGNLAWLKGSAGAPVWLTGGDYGPEGGFAATVALTLVTLFIWKSGLFSPSLEMVAATHHGSLNEKLQSGAISH